MRNRYDKQDFKEVPGPTGTAYEYIGPLYAVDLPGPRLLRLRILCAAFPVAGFALFLAMGFLNADGVRRFYIMLPYVGLLFPLGLLIGDAYKFWTAPPRMTRREYARSIVQMRHCAGAVMLLSLMVMLGEALFLLVWGGSTGALDAVFMTGAAGLFALFYRFSRIQRQIPVVSIDAD